MAALSVFLWLTLFASVGVQQVVSSVIGFGACPTPPVQNNFDVNQYTGVWYEYQRFPVPYELFVTCGQATYQLINATAISVDNTGIRDVTLGGHTLYRKRSQALGVATIPDPAVPAKLVVSFAGESLPQFARGNYWVLETDYITYSLVYSCFMIIPEILHFDSAWVLTRDQGVAPSNLGELHALLSDNGVDAGNFFTVSQDNCDISQPGRLSSLLL